MSTRSAPTGDEGPENSTTETDVEDGVTVDTPATRGDVDPYRRVSEGQNLENGTSPSVVPGTVSVVFPGRHDAETTARSCSTPRVCVTRVRSVRVPETRHSNVHKTPGPSTCPKNRRSSPTET